MRADSLFLRLQGSFDYVNVLRAKYSAEDGIVAVEHVFGSCFARRAIQDVCYDRLVNPNGRYIEAQFGGLFAVVAEYGARAEDVTQPSYAVVLAVTRVDRGSAAIRGWNLRQISQIERSHTRKILLGEIQIYV